MTFTMYELVDAATGDWLGVYAGRREALIAVREILWRADDAITAVALRWVDGDGATAVIAEGEVLASLAKALPG